MGQLADLYGTVRIDGAGVDRALDSIRGKLNATQGEMSGLESSLLSWGKSFIGVAAVTATLGMGLNEIAGDERALTKLSGVIRATGQASRLSATDLAAYASQLQDLTGIQDDVTVGAMALLATHNLSEPVLRAATALAQDMSILYGDMASSASALGKALEDPLQGIELLERMMKTRLSPAMKDLIRDFVELGDVGKAQAVILDFVKSKVGGLAEEAGKDLTGEIEKLKRAWEDLAAAAAKPLTLVVKVVADVIKGGENVLEGGGNLLEWIAELTGFKGLWAQHGPAGPGGTPGYLRQDTRPDWMKNVGVDPSKLPASASPPATQPPPAESESTESRKAREAFGAAASDMAHEARRATAMAEAGTDAERRRLAILHAEEDAYFRLAAVVEKLFGTNVPPAAIESIERVRQAIADAAEAKRTALADDEAAAAEAEDADMERALDRAKAEFDRLDAEEAAKEEADDRADEAAEAHFAREDEAEENALARKTERARGAASSLLDALADQSAAGNPEAMKQLWIERKKAELAQTKAAIEEAEGALSEEQKGAFTEAEAQIEAAAERRFKPRADRSAPMSATSAEAYLSNLQRSIGAPSDPVPTLIGDTNTKLDEIREVLKLGAAVTS